MSTAGGVFVALRTGVDGSVRWRLMAGNHRALGVSGRAFASEDAARENVVDVARVARTLNAQIVHPRSSVCWTWTALDTSGTLLAVAERTYGRYGTCTSAYQRFVHAIAVVADQLADEQAARDLPEPPPVAFARGS